LMLPGFLTTFNQRRNQAPPIDCKLTASPHRFAEVNS
jgi:hypothetical protein